MANEEAKVMGLGQIIAIMVGVALLLGLLVGGLGGYAGVPSGVLGAGVGGAVGFIGVLLLNKRKAALARRNPDR